MNLKTRRETIYAKATSLLLYGSELFTGQTEWTQRKITSILIKCNREIYRKNWFKVSNQKICRDILVDLPEEMLRKSTLRFFHKLVWNKKPIQLYENLKFNTKHRECSKISIKNPMRKQANRRTALYVGLDLYNNLKHGYKLTHPRQFKKQLKKMKV